MTNPRADESADRQLMARLLRGDEHALEELLQDQWDALVDYAASLLGSLDDAQDVVQDAFVRFWNRRRAWQPGSTARPILFRIVRNLALDQRRGAEVRAKWAASTALRQTVEPPVGAGALEEQELRAAIDLALQNLGERQREVVVLSRFHGLSRQQVTEVTGLAPGTVSNLLSDAMSRLCQELAPYLEAAPPLARRRVVLRKIQGAGCRPPLRPPK